MATTEPIRSYKEIGRILDGLDCRRDRALFIMGINTAFRGGDLLTLTIDQVTRLQVGDRLRLKESKTGKSRETLLNGESVAVLQELLTERLAQGAQLADKLFVSHRSLRPLTIVTLSRLWKEWSERAGLRGVYGSHSGRKTKAYILRVQEKQDIAVISKFLNHSNINVTMRYACIQDEEVLAVGMKSMTPPGLIR
jgi:integrase